MRTFISADISKEIQKQIKKIQEQIPEFFGKKTELENLHLTLKFLGEIDESKIEEVKNRLREIDFKKFETQINEVGVFSEKFIRIIWLYLKNCDELQKQIDDKLKNLFEPEKRFMSHLTIARVKKVENRKDFLEDLKKIKIPTIKFVVDKFYLKKSDLGPEGPVYEVIEKYDLE